MASLVEIKRLCRLCLVKDKVNTPIFDEHGDNKQISLKISACLPVKVSREDNLPKKICDECSYKLDVQYDFWNTTVNSEKQLLKWLSQGGVEKSKERVSVVPTQHSINTDVILKQEVIELSDTQNIDDLVSDDLPNEAHDYLLQQQQLPYPSVAGFSFQQDGFMEGKCANNIAGPSATITSEAGGGATPTRKRRAAAMKPLPPHLESEDEDDVDIVENKIAKTEEQSDESGCEDPAAFVGIPADNTDNEQPGPSGVGKGALEAPSTEINRADSTASPSQKPSRTKPNTSFAQCNRLFRCQKCDVAFATRKEIRRHKYTAHNEKRHPCKVCGLMFRYPSCVAVHERVHSKEKNFTCEVCSLQLKSKESFERHVQRHSSEFKCDRCGKGFFSRATCEKHVERVHLDIVLECDRCHKVYRDDYAYKYHLRTHDPDYKAKTYQCAECDAVLANRQSYSRHMQAHKGTARDCVCDICGKHITDKYVLKKHLLIHSRERPYVCERCGKTFCTKFVLDSHIRVHTKEKPFACELCGKRFTQKGSLTIHGRTHTGEKPFRCELCPKDFISKSLLTLHTKTHGISLANVKNDLN